MIGEMDCVYSVLDDRSGRRFHRRGHRGAEAAHAVPRACDQIGLSRAHRRDAGRDLSRSRRGPAGAARPHRARGGGPDRDGAVVQRSAQLHAHLRHLAARGDHSAAQRLRRRRRLVDPRALRRRAQADRRRRARHLSGRGTKSRLRRRARRRAGGAGGGRGAQRAQRLEKRLPATEMYLGLHLGEVFYGNIGSKERLDFTVVGPAVNEVSRIAAMCRSVDQPILISAAFAESCRRSAARVRLRRTLCAARRRPAAGTVHARSFRLSDYPGSAWGFQGCARTDCLIPARK